MTKMASVFLPTVDLSNRATLAAIRAETLKLRPGQWVDFGPGTRRGQFIRVERGVVYASWAGKGEAFDERTQRFARSVWHSRYKHEPVPAVTRAPRSVDLGRIKAWFVERFGGGTRQHASA